MPIATPPRLFFALSVVFVSCSLPVFAATLTVTNTDDSGTGTTGRNITVTNITGDGMPGISILAGTARDAVGHVRSRRGT